MQGYENKNALIIEIKKTASLFIKEFVDIDEKDKSKLIDGVDRTPSQIISYQLGWLDLIRKWDDDEAAGKIVVTPAPEYKWNNLGGLYQSFYVEYSDHSLLELQNLFNRKVEDLIEWLNNFTQDDLFIAGGRKWASSTPSNWPVWKWIHINTVAPFKSFRNKIRKWKKLNATE